MNYNIGEVIRIHQRNFTDDVFQPKRFIECVILKKEDYGIGDLEEVTVKILKTCYNGKFHSGSTSLPKRMNNTMTIVSNTQDVIKTNKMQLPYE